LIDFAELDLDRFHSKFDVVEEGNDYLDNDTRTVVNILVKLIRTGCGYLLIYLEHRKRRRLVCAHQSSSNNITEKSVVSSKRDLPSVTTALNTVPSVSSSPAIACGYNGDTNASSTGTAITSVTASPTTPLMSLEHQAATFAYGFGSNGSIPPVLRNDADTEVLDASTATASTHCTAAPEDEKFVD
jgi:hypothetical protein